MKKTIILFLIIAITPFITHSQQIENIDYISPVNDGVAAIKKGDQWGFINMQGDLVVNFRDDLVLTTSNEGNYPVFNSNRCLIKHIKDGISYFGYIDTSGKTVIEPQYLNATNFNNEVAIVLELVKEDAGRNEILGKNVVYYKYFEVTLDPNGTVKNYLTQKGVNIVLDKEFLKRPPKITTKLIADNVYAIRGENGKWTIKTIN